jgi:hypothetical protein
MAQTTTSLSWENTKLEFSPDNSTWTDISGSTNSVEDSGGEIDVNKLYTHGTTTPIVGYGKKAEHKVSVNVVYTETAGEAWALLSAAYEAQSNAYLRWSPKGGTSGQRRFTTGVGRITKLPYPSGKAESSDPVQISCELTCAVVTPTTI